MTGSQALKPGGREAGLYGSAVPWQPATGREWPPAGFEAGPGWWMEQPSPKRGWPF